MKKIIFTAIAIFGLAAITMAQVPNYVPTNGLVGWWPFNGNANDISGNGNNGTVNGATLTTDRFGSSNSAYSFNGTSNFISIPDNNSLDFTTTYTISVWVQIPDYSTPQFPNGSGSTDAVRTILGKPRSSGWTSGYSINSVYEVYQGLSNNFTHTNHDGTFQSILASNSPLPLNSWINIIAVKTPTNISLYRNGVLEQTLNTTLTLTNSSEPLYIGKEFTNTAPLDWYRWFKGKTDDIGIWNRALTQQEITALYNGVNCANNTVISPQINSLTTGSTATFTATTSDPNPSYVWQSNFGQGFQTLNNIGTYSGANSATLNIANVQLANHNQPIRVITTSGNCIDTSNVAIINIMDTCIVTVFDTLLTTVTDTLVINAQITGINPPNNLNTLKVFPNPANTYITIDYGNFNAMSGYTLKITNNLGQVVFTTPINQQSSYIDLSTWSGNGIYFVQIIDTQNNTIENRKIVLQ